MKFGSFLRDETRPVFLESDAMVVVEMKRDDAKCDRAGNDAEILLRLFC